MESASAKESASGLVAHFFRHEYGRLVATLVRRFHGSRLPMIEDAVQSALVSALSAWRRDGIPNNPAAWLTRAANNQVLDQLRRNGTAERGLRSQQNLTVLEADDTGPPDAPLSGDIADAELRMLFACCNERLTSQTSMVLSLKLLCGFAVHEIAARLFLSEENVQKILERGRAQLRELWASDPELDALSPSPPAIATRVTTVHRVVYLLFNEGYSSLCPDQPIRRDLCEEALRLARLLVEHPATSVPESWAILALFELHAARLDARSDGEGGLLLLEEQDRTRWDRAGIARGIACLWRSGTGDTFSRYHVEAAVLAEHCMAQSFEETRWQQIVELYEMLEAIEPSPYHTLNRAIALSEWRGPEVALELLRTVTPPGWLAGFYLWDATHGELLRRLGRFEQAEVLLERARDAAPTGAERRIFSRKLALCQARNAGRPTMRPMP